MTKEIPYHLFEGPVCRGDPILRNNCGHCEKCEYLAREAAKRAVVRRKRHQRP